MSSLRESNKNAAGSFYPQTETCMLVFQCLIPGCLWFSMYMARLFKHWDVLVHLEWCSLTELFSEGSKRSPKIRLRPTYG